MENLSEEIWSSSKKKTFSEESLISFSEFYSFFLETFKDITFQSNVAFEDTTVYGDRSLFEKILRTIRNAIFIDSKSHFNSHSRFTITATNNKHRKQIILEIKLKYSFNRAQVKEFKDYTYKIQKALEVIQGTFRVENLNSNPTILLILNTKEQNISPLKILIIDFHSRSLKQMIKYVKILDPFAQIVTVSDIKRVLTIPKKEFNVIILDPHISTSNFFCNQ